MRSYLGLTWDHPRGYQALRAAAAQLDPAIDALAIHWDTQTLEGFEAAPIAELCARYDLVVLDHPHIGEAVAQRCLQPISDLFDADTLASIDRDTIGPSFSSYRFAGRQWALPLDAATQVMAARADLLEENLPQTWHEVVALSERAPVTLSLAGPHAALSFQSIAVALGEPPAKLDPERFVGTETGRAVLDLMATLASRMPAIVREANPIGILEHMARHDDVVLCPLVYGYVNYAVGSSERRAICFGNAPRAMSGGLPGSTIGGTGIAISARAEISPALVNHLRWLMSANTQVRFISAEAGQPSRRDAWQDASVNAAWKNFYHNTAETMERGYVRPCHDGAIAFQAMASGLIREALAGRSHGAVLDALQNAYTASRTARIDA